jgi:hypothetical protein
MHRNAGKRACAGRNPCSDLHNLRRSGRKSERWRKGRQREDWARPERDCVRRTSRSRRKIVRCRIVSKCRQICTCCGWALPQPRSDCNAKRLRRQSGSGDGAFGRTMTNKQSIRMVRAKGRARLPSRGSASVRASVVNPNAPVGNSGGSRSIGTRPTRAKHLGVRQPSGALGAAGGKPQRGGIFVDS